MEVDQVDFRELTKPAVLKKTLRGMLHLSYPLRKPSPPETPDTSDKAPKVAAIAESRTPFPHQNLPRFVVLNRTNQSSRSLDAT